MSGIVGDASASVSRSGEDVRKRGWFWHWNSIVTQYAPLLGLKGVGLLNSYTVWTDRREESPHRGYAFPSQQSEAGAQASANTLQRKFGTLFNGAKLSIIKVDLGAKGIYYRVIMPTSSLADAQQLCGSIKSSGGDCVAANG